MNEIVCGALTYLMRLLASNGMMRKRGMELFAKIDQRVEAGHDKVIFALQDVCNCKTQCPEIAEIADSLLGRRMPEASSDVRQWLLNLLEVTDGRSFNEEEVIHFLCLHLSNLQRQRNLQEISRIFEHVGRYLAPNSLFEIATEGRENFYSYAALQQVGRYGGDAGMLKAAERYARLLQGDDPHKAALGLQELARGWPCSLSENFFPADGVADALEVYCFSLREHEDDMCSIAPLGASLFLRDERVQGRLVGLLAHPNCDVQRAAGIGLHRLHPKCHSMLLPSIQKWLMREQAKREDIEAGKMLEGANVGDPEQLVKTPGQCSNHPHPEVRRWGLLVVSQFQQQNAGHLFHQVLIDILEKETDPIVVDALHWVALGELETSDSFVREVLAAFGRNPANRKLEALLDVLHPDEVVRISF